MKIKIYQIDIDKDVNRVCFQSYETLKKLQNSDKVNSSIYDEVFAGEVEAKGLEDIYRIFNIDIPDGYTGRSISVSDVIKVVKDADECKKGFYFCDSIGFKKIEFDSSVCGRKKKKIKVVLCKPGKKAEITEIKHTLKDLQTIVGGHIEAYYPFEEAVCIVCNEDGKFAGLPLNRAICDEDGKIMDIIAGDFFICDCSGSDFGSLSEELAEKYRKMFEFPENIIMVNGKITAVKYDPVILNPVK